MTRWARSTHQLKYHCTVSPQNGVSVVPVGVVYNEGDNVTFLCSAKGGPGNYLQWLKNGEDVSNIIDNSENNLTLTDITVSGDGAVYTCVASNVAGTGIASVSLNIHPVLIDHPMDVMTTNGTNETFTCNAIAFPPPTYIWHKVDDILPETANGESSSTLILSPAVFGSEGEYYCNATSNGITVSSNTATLTSESCILYETIP